MPKKLLVVEFSFDKTTFVFNDPTSASLMSRVLDKYLENSSKGSRYTNNDGDPTVFLYGISGALYNLVNFDYPKLFSSEELQYIKLFLSNFDMLRWDSAYRPTGDKAKDVDYYQVSDAGAISPVLTGAAIKRLQLDVVEIKEIAGNAISFFNDYHSQYQTTEATELSNDRACSSSK